LQIVAPCGDLLHSGVRVVPQLLCYGQYRQPWLVKVRISETDLQTWPPGVRLLPGGGLDFDIDRAVEEAGLAACDGVDASSMGLSAELGEMLLELRAAPWASGRSDVSPGC
jgi:hypothetical protein